MLKAPEIEILRQKDIVGRIREIAPFYIPDLDVMAEKGSDAALLYIFAGMMDMIVQRLNEVPDKNLIAFLDMMSVKLLPPQPARVPLTFILSEGAKSNVTILQKNQVAAGDIIYEMDKTFIASPAKLLKAYSIDFKNDEVFAVQVDIVNGEKIVPFKSKLLYDVKDTDTIFLASVAGLRQGDVLYMPSGYYSIVNIIDNKVILDRMVAAIKANVTVSKVVSFDFFERDNLQRHILYFGDSHLFNIKSDFVNIRVPDVLQSYDWEYYGEDKDGVLGWHLLFLLKGVLHKTTTGEIREFDINGIKNRWIRCRLEHENKNLIMDNPGFLSSIYNFSKNDGIDEILVHSPWGVGILKYGDGTFTVPMMSPNGTRFGGWLLNTGDNTFGPIGDFDGDGIDEILVHSPWGVGILKYGDGTFTVPMMSPNGTRFGGWLLNTGDNTFGPIGDFDGEPPLLIDMAFYNDIPLDITTNSDGSLKSSIYPFGQSPKLYDTFYIGSQEVFSKKGAEVTLTIIGAFDGTAIPAISSQLSWEYWDGAFWMGLGVQGDLVSNLLIDNLPEIKPIKVNGVENLWIRVRLVGGDYGQKVYLNGTTLASGNITPPEIISIKVLYEYKTPRSCENYLVYSNLEYRDITDECRDDKIVAPFEMIDGSGVHFYLGFDKKPEKGPVSIFFDLDTSLQGNAFSTVRWEYCSQISEGKEKWDRLEVLDNTKGFTQSDTIEFVFSDMFKTRKLGQELYWIRVTALNPNSIKSKIKSIHMNTSWASQMQTFKDVVLGSSDGSADQVYLFPKQPILSAEVWVNEINSLSESEKENLRMNKTKPVEKKDKDGNIIEFWVKWEGVNNLFTANTDSRKYEIDRAAGYIKFGDNSHGRVPAIGRNNIKADYQTGGGIKGNVGIREINTLKTSVAFVDKVFNPISAGGGSDIELISNAVDRGTHIIKNRNRVITEEDYEYMVKEFSSGIAMVNCLANSKQKDDKIEYHPGDVVVVIIPHTSDDKPVPSIQLITQVESYLKNFTPATADIQVISPYYWSVNTDISIKTKALEYIPAVEKEVSAKLKEFLHPLRGGEVGEGWQFGRIPYLSDIYAVIEKIDGVDYVESLKIKLIKDNGTAQKEIIENNDQLFIAPYEIIFNGIHTISVM